MYCHVEAQKFQVHVWKPVSTEEMGKKAKLKTQHIHGNVISRCTAFQSGTP